MCDRLCTPKTDSSLSQPTDACDLSTLLSALCQHTHTHTHRVTAYASALHEHCAGLLQQSGAQECRLSTRCMLVAPDGIAGNVDGDGSIINGSSLGSTNGFKEPALLVHTRTNSDGSEADHSSTIAFWRAAAAALKLQQPACLPITAQFDELRLRSCAARQLQGSQPRADAQQTESAVLRYQQLCEANPAACFMRNASTAADVSQWWTGDSPQETLESSSSWRDRQRLQRIAQSCADSWAVQDRVHVLDKCATRGVGRMPWNNSLTLNRLLVATMDAYESSGCNNTVTFSEAMAVEIALRDLCSDSNCQATSSAAAGRRQAGSRPLVLAVLLAAAAWLALL